MTNGYALQMALGALAALGLGAVGVAVLPPLLVPADRALGPQIAPLTAATPDLAPATPRTALTAEAPVPASAVPGPRFDTVRVEPDGTGLVAGRAAPGAAVTVLAGSVAVGEATADASGRFVAFLEIAPSPEPRALSLRQADGAQGPDTVLLAPTAAPAVALASAVPGVEGVVQLAAPSAALPSRAAPADGAAGPNPAAPAGRPDPAPGSAAAPLVVVTVPAQPARPEPPAQAAVLLSDEGGVRVLQPALPASADPEVLATVALDAISYDGAGEVLVQGRGTPGDAVRLYLDNVPAAEAAIAPDGTWATPLTKAEPGTYTLRLDQLDAAGEVVSRIETPFLRERRDDLAAASAQAGFRIVQPGNTLWAIARDRYGEPMMYVRVFEANRDRIRNPDLIYPGQVFLLPDADAL